MLQCKWQRCLTALRLAIDYWLALKTSALGCWLQALVVSPAQRWQASLPQKYSQIAEGAGFLGDVGANIAINFAPRPQVNRIYEQLGAEQAAAAEAQQQMREQELVQSLLQSGLLTAEGVRALS